MSDGPGDGVIGDRSFSADPHTASRYAVAFSQGLSEAGVVPAAKHFPGHGRSTIDTHSDTALVPTSIRQLRASDLVPFVALIEAGVPVMLLNHLQYQGLDPELPASLSPRAYRLLRELGFQGVAVTDSLAMAAVSQHWSHGRAAVQAIVAGADLVLTAHGEAAMEMREAVVAAVLNGNLHHARLREAAARVRSLAQLLRAAGPQITDDLVAALAHHGRAIRPTTLETALAELVTFGLAAADGAGQGRRWAPLVPAGDPLLDAVDFRGAHDFRHTFATRLGDDGIPARVIDELMGHEPSTRGAQHRCDTPPELLLSGGAPRRNRTGDPILTMSL
jgi:Glycosyl hydrolase family 3 N terminal domain/Phage integrase family